MSRNDTRRHRLSLLLVAFALAATPALAQDPVPGGEAPGIGSVTAEERRDVVNTIAKLLEDRYVFPDVGVAAGKHLKAELERGAYSSITDARELATTLTTSLQSISRDKHMRVVVKPPQAVGEDRGDPIAQHARQLEALASGNFGFQKVERLEGNIGYLDLRGFAPADLARETAVAAMRMLAGSDAIVIDLRRNGGGSPDMVRLICSYFFEAPTHLNSLYWREGDRTQEFWTSADVPGPRMTDVPLYVLTSSRTFSGAEEFSYNMQSRGRATLIGETTGGGANPGGVFPANERFGIFVPTGRAINPVTKTNWEGVGVKPDVAVAAERALDTALVLARTAAVEHQRAELDAARTAREALAAELRRAEGAMAGGRRDEGGSIVASALEAARAKGIVGEGLINGLGYDYLGRGAVPMAIAVFEFNTKAYPTSGNTFDSLGEAYLAAGDATRALASYRRSLELDPDNGNARTVIAKMEKGKH